MHDDGALRIERITLDAVDMPLKEPFVTSFGREAARRFYLVGIEGDGVTGWAETVAGDLPLYSEETNGTVLHMVRDVLTPLLVRDPIPDPEDVRRRFLPLKGNRMAKAGLEMAVWDWFGRRRGEPLWRLLGGRARDIPVGVSIGIQPSVDRLVAMARSYLAQGYRRLKVKIRPGWDWEPLRALREALPTALIMADANSAYTLAEADTLAQLDPLELMMIEQPLAEDDLVDHAALQRRLRTPICLDESIRSADDARRAIAIGACRVINVKVGRVGGFAEARRLAAVAEAAGIPVWCGGMLESGIGRAANLHLTTLPAFVLPGDTSGSDRYFARDLVDPPFRVTAAGTLALPTGPGLGVEPDPDALRHYRRGHQEWTAGGWR
jgi:O-succinylbenzoate synthase